MDVINCKDCGRLFNAISRTRLCPQCQRKLEDKFQEVKAFINENPGSTIDMVSEACEVSSRQIKQWVREERLTFSADSCQGIECEQCGAMIRSGRFCEACKTKLQNELRSATYIPTQEERKTTRDKDRMRFLQGL